MKSSDTYQPTQGFGVLIQGPPKTGKTSLALQFPRPYIADCDNNLAGAVRRLKELEAKDGKKRPFAYDVIGIGDDGKEVPMSKRWQRLCDCCKIAAADPNIDTIIVDSLSMVDSFLQAHIVAAKTGEKEKHMTISDWIPYKNLMTLFISTFRSVGKIFIMTSHEAVEKDEGTGLLVYKVNMASKLQDNFAGFFSDCWLTKCDEIGNEFVYYVRTMPDPRRNGVGNSLGLPTNFKFTWEDFAVYLRKVFPNTSAVNHAQLQANIDATKKPEPVSVPAVAPANTAGNVAAPKA